MLDRYDQEEVMADGRGVRSSEWWDLQPARDRGVSRLACLLVLAAALFGCVMPQAAGAQGAFARSKVAPAYPVCRGLGPGDAGCLAIRVPSVPVGSSDSYGLSLPGSGEKSSMSTTIPAPKPTWKSIVDVTGFPNALPATAASRRSTSKGKQQIIQRTMPNGR
jgi:hypothetical protein